MALTPGPNMIYLVSRSLSQGFLLGAIQIAVSAAVNATIVLAASAVAAFSATRPAWLRGQRLVTGALLAAFALRLALGGG